MIEEPESRHIEEWLRTGSLIQLCIDMQRLFGPEGPWPTPWMEQALPNIVTVAERFGARAVFTRFIPARDPAEEIGTWRQYYRRWSEVTLNRLDPSELVIVAELAHLAPPARIVDKRRFSAFSAPALAEILNGVRADTLIVTGAETDMCVLATVMDAVDRGYRVIVVEDAVCSSSDKGHDAILTLYRTRFAEQVETVSTQGLLALIDSRALSCSRTRFFDECHRGVSATQKG